MGLRAYQTWLAITYIVFGGALLLAAFFISIGSSGEPFVVLAEWMTIGLGLMLLLAGFIGVGAAMAGTSTAKCIHCGKDARVHIGFFSGRPELRRSDAGS